jgi:hypothetical protein
VVPLITLEDVLEINSGEELYRETGDIALTARYRATKSAARLTLAAFCTIEGIIIGYGILGSHFGDVQGAVVELSSIIAGAITTTVVCAYYSSVGYVRSLIKEEIVRADEAAAGQAKTTS